MMKKHLRGFALAAAASAALLAAMPAASSAKEITVAVSATFSTLDPYDDAGCEGLHHYPEEGRQIP